MIKQHPITGLKYLCKSTSKEPLKYNGSGKYWKRHLNKHGKEGIITCWISKEYTLKEEIQKDALYMSIELDIVNSKEWANLILENGLDGGYTSKEWGGKSGFRNKSKEEIINICKKGIITRNNASEEIKEERRLNKSNSLKEMWLNKSETERNQHSINISLALKERTEEEKEISNNKRLLTISLKEKPKCNNCGKEFFNKGNLTQHSKICKAKE